MATQLRTFSTSQPHGTRSKSLAKHSYSTFLRLLIQSCLWSSSLLSTSELHANSSKDTSGPSKPILKVNTGELTKSAAGTLAQKLLDSKDQRTVNQLAVLLEEGHFDVYSISYILAQITEYYIRYYSKDSNSALSARDGRGDSAVFPLRNITITLLNIISGQKENTEGKRFTIIKQADPKAIQVMINLSALGLIQSPEATFTIHTKLAPEFKKKMNFILYNERNDKYCLPEKQAYRLLLSLIDLRIHPGNRILRLLNKRALAHLERFQTVQAQFLEYVNKVSLIHRDFERNTNQNKPDNKHPIDYFRERLKNAKIVEGLNNNNNAYIHVIYHLFRGIYIDFFDLVNLDIFSQAKEHQNSLDQYSLSMLYRIYQMLTLQKKEVQNMFNQSKKTDLIATLPSVDDMIDALSWVKIAYQPIIAKRQKTETVRTARSLGESVTSAITSEFCSKIESCAMIKDPYSAALDSELDIGFRARKQTYYIEFNGSPHYYYDLPDDSRKKAGYKMTRREVRRYKALQKIHGGSIHFIPFFDITRENGQYSEKLMFENIRDFFKRRSLIEGHEDS